MIISHRHKFIYLKARKVAGTSVEVALAQHCGDEDIVTPVGPFNPSWDEEEYAHPGKEVRGYSRHLPLIPLRRRLGRKLWDAYFKFAVTRNPWDLVVSQYHWATRSDYGDSYKGSVGRSLKRFWTRPLKVRKNSRQLGTNLARTVMKMDVITFEFYVTHMLRYYESNDRFYFDRSGSVALDFLIRYEHLQEDYTSVCDRLGLPVSEVPSLKTKARVGRRHYTTYYNDRARERVAKMYHRHIEHFGYRFEER